MKKVISIALISLGVAGFVVNNANATMNLPKTNSFETCTVLNNSGWGSHFKSRDRKMDAVLYYNQKNGPGVSGGFGAIVNGVHNDSPLIDSTCQWGVVTLKWDKPGFKGQLIGNIDISNARITNVNGIINDKEVHDDLIFVG